MAARCQKKLKNGNKRIRKATSKKEYHQVSFMWLRVEIIYSNFNGNWNTYEEQYDIFVSSYFKTILIVIYKNSKIE